MNIILNNRPEIIEASCLTVKELLKLKRFTFKLLVVKINDKLIKRDYYETTIINEGDNVTVMHLVSGG